ncbi:MAG: efflux RND transporter periplasmic adaptor subunit [Planctomycetia bacterium]|nr:efflux RND transporter periplasmic adaptor subunit [Planctomycetia bacterium]
MQTFYLPCVGFCCGFLSLLLCGCAPSEPANAKSITSETLLQVGVMTPETRNVTDVVVFTGELRAVDTVDIQSQVSGILAKKLFAPGAIVQKGELLFEIEPEVYNAVLASRKAELAVLEARLPRLQTDWKRAQELYPSGALSEVEYEQSLADYKECLASLEQAKAEILKAEIDVKYTQIVAPINGAVSRELVTVGNLVTANDTLLAKMVSLDPIHLYFNIDETTLLKLLRQHPDAANKISIPFRLSDGESEFVAKLDYSSPYMDSNSGTLQLRAICENTPDSHGRTPLLPGMMAHVQLPVSEEYSAILIPEACIGTDQNLKYVYIVDQENKIQIRQVVLGALQQDNMRVVQDGIQADDKIVVDNLLRVRPGLTVETQTIDN